MKHILFFTSILISSFSYATTYEDGVSADDWRVVTGSGATIASIGQLDPAIQLSGNGVNNQYAIGDIPNWTKSWGNTNERIIKWTMSYSENFTIYIRVLTTEGSRNIYYRPQNSDLDGKKPNTGNVLHGLGVDAKNGTWQTFTRDLEADLKEFDPNNNIISVDGFFIRGSGFIKSIELLPTVQYPASLADKPISPKGNISDSTPTYSWKARSARGYNLWVNDKTGNVINKWYTPEAAGCADNTGTCSVTPEVSLVNGKGWWRVSHSGDLDDFPWSAANSFNLEAESTPTIIINLDKLKAFPTAEGAGANSKGGRGGEVIYVINHDASGEGSLKWALAQEKPRTILFAVGGRFNINENIRLSRNHSNVTLAGQTANDIGGVHLAQSDFNICNFERALTVVGQHDLTFRYFDSRYNWQYLLTNHDTTNCPINSRTGKPFDLSGQKLPTLRFVTVQDLIIDHVSSGWSSYGLAVTNQNHDNLKTGNISIQRSLMHENIINPNGQNHNIGMLLGTKGSREDTKEQWNNVEDFSVHHNAFIGESHRFPNTAGGDNAKFRIINNYIYGFKGDATGERLSRIGGNAKNDFVNNVYQEATYGNKFEINDPTRRTGNNLLGFQHGTFLPMTEPDGFMKTPRFGIIERPNFHLDGNLFLNSQGEELDHITNSILSDPTLMTFRYHAYGHDFGNDGENRKESQLDGEHLQLGLRDNLILRNNPLSTTDSLANPVSSLPANLVKANVLNNVGGNVRFNQDGTTFIDDTVDKKYIDWARNYTGPTKYTTSLNDQDVGSHQNFVYPNYISGSRHLATFDSDGDGMPNEWEKKHHLSQDDPNPTDAANAVRADRNWTFDNGNGKYLVKNNAGYTNLEMYLADIAGDFHMLANK